ncbi:acyltransferase domain-containing protein [Pseudomonas typographi]|uniref:acyltransferase domain-containing protein n=1 Tax=Pseudomonas typographi TaxID=2715964 RepID=UPI00168833BB|nr:acyltransferase domain-containing protein [Pseudomonas typographi]MBD1553119.1 acyltransferase domain-containing protein [Pseudomonas typographi]MBD1585894.1 acyltransferase domain-containing protein [Pseudomonas typographi]
MNFERPGALAIAFPGQGSQFRGMGLELLPRFREMTEIAETLLGLRLAELLEDAGRLADTAFTQPAVFVVSAMSFEAMSNSKKGPRIFPKAPSSLPSRVMTSSNLAESTTPCTASFKVFIKSRKAAAISLPKRDSGVAGITPADLSSEKASLSKRVPTTINMTRPMLLKASRVLTLCRNGFIAVALTFSVRSTSHAMNPGVSSPFRHSASAVL